MDGQLDAGLVQARYRHRAAVLPHEYVVIGDLERTQTTPNQGKYQVRCVEVLEHPDHEKDKESCEDEVHHPCVVEVLLLLPLLNMGPLQPFLLGIA